MPYANTYVQYGILQGNHAIAMMTARCAQYVSALKIVGLGPYVSAKTADDCARISTLQSYHYSAVKLFSKYSIQYDRGT